MDGTQSAMSPVASEDLNTRKSASPAFWGFEYGTGVTLEF